jgi:phosphopantothenoylcysteine decarboxylase/phosphopantothenate--cysteine ligase
MLHFNFSVDDMGVLANRRIGLGVTGGIAAYKAIEVLRGLQQAGCEVRVAMTKHACEFVQPLTFRALSGCYVVVDDYSSQNPDPIAHITFSQTIDLFIIAPATANTLAKLANGVADDFVSSTYLACTAPVLLAPAMNPMMWKHPATQRNLERLRTDGIHIVEPDEGEMACGTFGPGRLSEPERIVAAALEILRASPTADTRPDTQGKDLNDERILITVGATREAIDPVRFISNRSSGRMGFALARAARGRGAAVTVVSGRVSVPEPTDMRVIRVESAEQMRKAVMDEAPNMTVFIAAAAVSDYRPKETFGTKIKKSEAELELKLERTPDILGSVAKERSKGQLIVGFAAETNDLLRHAREKLLAKNLDMVVANDVTAEGAGFELETNKVVLLLRDHPEPFELPLLSKEETAHRVLDEIAKLRAAATAESAAKSVKPKL